MADQGEQKQGVDYVCSSCNIHFNEVIHEATARCPSCLKITSVTEFKVDGASESSKNLEMAYPLVFCAIALVWVLLAIWVIFETRTSNEASRFFRLGAWATVLSIVLIAMEEVRMAIKNRPKAPPWTPDVPLSD